jgi:hypothetical protein
MFDFDVITGPTIRAPAENRADRAPKGSAAPPPADARSAPPAAAETPLVPADPAR